MIAELMGWFAFFATIVILLVYRAGEKRRVDTCRMRVDWATSEIKRLQGILAQNIVLTKPNEPLPILTYFPELAEGARFMHDVKSDIFIGQYKDADVYAEGWEYVGPHNEFGEEPGYYGSLLRFRHCDARKLGVTEMLSSVNIAEAIADGQEDEYGIAGAELARKAGMVKEYKRGGRDVVVLFRPLKEDVCIQPLM